MPSKPRPGATADRPAAGDTITPYYGEFLISPIPLELSFNYCSHKCGYCFANLNRPGRWADVGATLALLRDFRSRGSLEATLLREGYPVLVSNRVDPFAASNKHQSLPVLRTMAELGVPVCVQTRGGFGVEEALDFLPPSLWCISITFADDAGRKRVEPGAPTIASRFDLIEALRARGHVPVLALNPYVPDWVPDAEALVRRARDCGARGMWVEHLHLSRDQIARMTTREVSAIGPDVMALAQRQAPRPEIPLIEDAIAAAEALGVHPFTMGMIGPTRFFDLFREVYPKTFPVMHDLVNRCHAAGWREGDLLTFGEFARFLGQRLPAGRHRLTYYLGSTSRKVAKDVPLKHHTYADLLRVIWSDRRCKVNPTRLRCFAYAADDTPGGWVEWHDEAGIPYLGFSPAGFPDVCFPATES